MLEVLKKLAADLALLFSSSGTLAHSQGTPFTFSGGIITHLTKSLNAARSDAFKHKDTFMHYDKQETRNVFNILLTEIQKILDTSESPIVYHLPANQNNQILTTCLEIDILIALATFKVPLDFPFGNERQFADLLEELCQRIKTFITTPSTHPLAYQAVMLTLQNLTKFDLTATASLETSSQTLISEIFSWIHSTYRCDWKLGKKVYLLWCNAVHGLKNDGSYQPALTWNTGRVTVNRVLLDIEAELLSGEKLTEDLARVLFQIHAVEYANRHEFPRFLHRKMELFKEQFQQTAHGSRLEDRIQTEHFEGSNGIIKQISKDYPYVKMEQIDFRNPVTELGLEADFLYRHPASQLAVAFQIDGEVHNEPRFFSSTPIKLRKRTLFRDFCFDQANFPHIEITATDTNISDRVRHQLIDLLIIPLHQYLQNSRIEKLERTQQSLEDKAARLPANLQQGATTISHYLLQIKEVVSKTQQQLELLKQLKKDVTTSYANAYLTNVDLLAQKITSLQHQANQELARIVRQQDLLKQFQDVNLSQLSDQITVFKREVDTLTVKNNIAKLTTQITRTNEIIAQQTRLVKKWEQTIAQHKDENTVLTAKIKQQEDTLVKWLDAFNVSPSVETIKLAVNLIKLQDEGLNTLLTTYEKENSLKRKTRIQAKLVKQFNVVLSQVDKDLIQSQIEAIRNEIAMLKAQKHDLVADANQAAAAAKAMQKLCKEADALRKKLSAEHKFLRNDKPAKMAEEQIIAQQKTALAILDEVKQIDFQSGDQIFAESLTLEKELSDLSCAITQIKEKKQQALQEKTAQFEQALQEAGAFCHTLYMVQKNLTQADLTKLEEYETLLHTKVEPFVSAKQQLKQLKDDFQLQFGSYAHLPDFSQAQNATSEQNFHYYKNNLIATIQAQSVHAQGNILQFTTSKAATSPKVSALLPTPQRSVLQPVSAQLANASALLPTPQRSVLQPVSAQLANTPALLPHPQQQMPQNLPVQTSDVAQLVEFYPQEMTYLPWFSQYQQLPPSYYYSTSGYEDVQDHFVLYEAYEADSQTDERLLIPSADKRAKNKKNTKSLATRRN